MSDCFGYHFRLVSFPPSSLLPFSFPREPQAAKCLTPNCTRSRAALTVPELVAQPIRISATQTLLYVYFVLLFVLFALIPVAKTLGFRGLDSGRILILRGGILRPIGNFRQSLSQQISVGIVLAGRLGVPRTKNVLHLAARSKKDSRVLSLVRSLSLPLLPLPI